MPIPFTCPHCGQLMRVGKRKVGQAIQCIRCHGGVIVPGAGEEAPVPPLPTQSREEEDSPLRTTRQPLDSLVISRSVVYTVGGLLVAVGVVSFLLGFGMARSLTRQQAEWTAAKQPLRISGQLVYRGHRDRTFPDTEAVVVALPVGRKPDERLPSTAFRPDQPSPSARDPVLQAIRTLGGEVRRTGSYGEFELQLPQGGAYHLLLLSNHLQRDSNRPPTTTEMVELGYYFQNPTELLGTNDFLWSKQVVHGDVTVDHVFGE